MPEAERALGGAEYTGFARVAEQDLRGMIALRGDLAGAELRSAVLSTVGVEVPGTRGIVHAADNAVAWMSPDELLIFLPWAEVSAARAALGTALAGTHHLVVNVSDARALFRVSGTGARDTIAKLSPADLSPSAFGPGEMRRSRLAQVSAAFWMPDAETVEVLCFRSVAGYVFEVLARAAMPGSEVEYFGSGDRRNSSPADVV